MRSLLFVALLAAGAGAQDASWRTWWLQNRETFAPFRSPPTATFPLGKHHESVRSALRRRARDGDKPNRAQGRFAIAEVSLGDQPVLRSAATVALGRLGDQRDVFLIIEMMRNHDERNVISQAGALALAAMRPPDDATIRANLEKRLKFWLENDRWAFKDRNTAAIVSMRKVLPSFTHLLVSTAAGVHARDNFEVLNAMVEAVQRPAKDTQQYKGSLVLGCGLTNSRLLTPELIEGVKTSAFADEPMNDVTRADAVAALARIGTAGAPVMVALLNADKVQLHTRRACALGLGRLLRTGLSGTTANGAEAELVTALWAKGKPILGGFAAIALGESEPPRQIDELIRALEEAQEDSRRTYIAIALGLAARRASRQPQRRIVDVLLAVLRNTKNRELEAACCIALGLAREPDVLPELIERIENGSALDGRPRGGGIRQGPVKGSTGGSVRNAAIQGAGLLGERTPKLRAALIDILERPDTLSIEDALVTMKMVGEPDVEELALRLYEVAKRSRARDRIRTAVTLAAGRLRIVEFAPMFARKLEDDLTDQRLREASAVALGMLASPHRHDPLTEMHADVNHHAKTATRKLATRLCGNYGLRLPHNKTQPRAFPTDRRGR